MSTILAQDLRGEAKDYQRTRNHNAKWARGFAPAQGKSCPHTLAWPFAEPCDECAKRPQHRDYDRRCGRHYTELKRNQNQKISNQKSAVARKVFRNEVVELIDAPIANPSDSSGEDDVRDEPPEPVSEVGIMYSYDLPNGPGRGHDVLSHAINQAVVRFENKVTEKLAKEYDFVDDGKDVIEGYAADADEDDFEVIEHAHLN